MPQPMIDAKLYERNTGAFRGVLSRMDPFDRFALIDKVGVKREFAARDRERMAVEALAYQSTAAGVDVEQGARVAAAKMNPGLWSQLAKNYRGRVGGENSLTVPLAGAGRKKKKKAGPFRAIQNEIGRGLNKAGTEVKRWTKAPVVGQYIVGPMGFEAIGETLAQTGKILKGGSIRDWDDRAFVLALGHSMSSTGQALIAASPFLPAPWNAAALAAGTASLMIGKAMVSHVNAQEQKQQVAESYAPEAEYPQQGESVETVAEAAPVVADERFDEPEEVEI